MRGLGSPTRLAWQRQAAGIVPGSRTLTYCRCSRGPSPYPPLLRSPMPARLSVLDLAPVAQDETPADSFRHSVDLARAAEQHGYERVWYAEHHNIPGIASSATSVLI